MASNLDVTIFEIFRRVPTFKQIESCAWLLIDLTFGPKQLLFQLLLLSCLQLAAMGIQSFHRVGRYSWTLLSSKARAKRNHVKRLLKASHYSAWKQDADELDKLIGYDKWRSTDSSPFFDYKLLNKRIIDTVDMIARGDVFNLMFRLRGGLARDQFGMQHEGLFSKAMGGTKHIVEKYHETIVQALNYICDSSDIDEIPTDVKLAFFNETRHAYGRTALLLSGGAYLGYYHVGVCKALRSQGLLPRVISGASAGSLMAAVFGVRTDAELDDMDRTEAQGEIAIRHDFFKFSDRIKSPLGHRIQQLIPHSLRWALTPLLGLFFDGKVVNLDTEHFIEAVKHNVGNYTFQEAFDRTGRIINVIVSPTNHYDPPRLLNYLTAPHVCVWSAAVASCAIPGVFDAGSLVVKESNGSFAHEHEWVRQGHVEGSTDVAVSSGAGMHSYSDGSLQNDLPMQELSEQFNVNHFIVSQVNAHSALVSSVLLRNSGWSDYPLYGLTVAFVDFLRGQCRGWLRNMTDLLSYASNGKSLGLVQTLTQKYEGRGIDVTMMPWSGHIGLIRSFLYVLRNPSHEEYLDVIAFAERYTWPYIARIKAHCMVEIGLDKCVQRLRRRLSDEEANSSPTRRSGGGSKIDRTPSFCTSRSLVNLSGLSVADPAARSNINSNSNSNSMMKRAVSGHHSGDRVGMNTRGGDGEELHGVAASDNISLDPMRLVGRDLDDCAPTMTMELVGVDDGWLEDDTQGGARPDLRADGETAGIKKSTSMANFYYKRSRSEELLNPTGGIN